MDTFHPHPEEPAQPASLRTALQFETASDTYDWLNRVLAVGVGRREPDGVTYDVYEIL